MGNFSRQKVKSIITKIPDDILGDKRKEYKHKSKQNIAVDSSRGCCVVLLAGMAALLLSIGESLFLRKLVLGIPAQASSKNLTRPLMPPAAPIRPRHLVPTQQGVGT
ncbi:hypothetical protein BJAS_P2295 [Bathymodiolus japonicus methanotrophic gill symbiont]|nr:hypothetical protein BJAS_P2295 [Bathymodiolus japonicus methanotrophic gill symbiont]